VTLQSTFSIDYAEAVLGMRANGFGHGDRVLNKIARGLLKAGYGAFRVGPASIGGAGASTATGPGLAFQNPVPAIAADVDAILATGGASTAGIQTFDASDFDGVVGADEMTPARAITLVLSNHADWNATNATLTGVNHLGQTVSETLAIPDGGNATVTSTGYYRQVTGLTIPAQGGTGGTFTVGISAITSLVIGDYLGVVLRQPVLETRSTDSVYSMLPDPGVADYVDFDSVPLMKAGAVWVYSEEAVADGDPVYVRVASGGGGSQLGAFRNDADTASAVLVVGATFTRNSSGAGLAQAHFAY